RLRGLPGNLRARHASARRVRDRPRTLGGQADPGREHPGGHAVPPGPAPPDAVAPAVRSRVDAEASGYLVGPPVFKTGERRAAALAGSIPVRLRYLRSYQVPTRPAPAAYRRPIAGCEPVMPQ